MYIRWLRSSLHKFIDEFTIKLYLSKLLYWEHKKLLNRLNCLSLQVDRRGIRGHIHGNHDIDGNAWCHVGSCSGSYQAYRINIWGIQSPEENRRVGRNLVAQQALNIERHLEKVHGAYICICIHSYDHVCVCACVRLCILVISRSTDFLIYYKIEHINSLVTFSDSSHLWSSCYGCESKLTPSSMTA